MLALFGHGAISESSLLSGVNRSSRLRPPTSEIDPTETSRGATISRNRLVEVGLTVRTKPKQAPVACAARAKDLASKATDKLTVHAPDDEKASRKRRLIKGPEEFREDRVDLPKVKGK